MCKTVEDFAKDYAKTEKEKMISNMLSSGKTPEAIADFVGIPLEEVKKVECHV